MKITNEDNMQLMARYEDNHFDLAIVDPPYGIGEDGRKETKTKKASHKRQHREFKGWDKNIPKKEYFLELQRVSKNQIIFGGNYFANLLPNSRCWLFWDKGQDLSMPDGELMWTSFEKPIRRKVINRAAARVDGIFHPTQKPIKIYNWLLHNYAKEGDKILDTHLGSGSIAIACHNMKYDLTACELDEEYYDKAMERIEQHKKQLTLF